MKKFWKKVEEGMEYFVYILFISCLLLCSQSYWDLFGILSLGYG